MPGGDATGGDRRLHGRKVPLVEDQARVALPPEDAMRDAGTEPIGPPSSLREAFRLAGAALADGGIDAVVLDGTPAGEAVLAPADGLEGRGGPFVVASGSGAAPVLAKPPGLAAPVAAPQAVKARG